MRKIRFAAPSLKKTAGIAFPGQPECDADEETERNGKDGKTQEDYRFLFTCAGTL